MITPRLACAHPGHGKAGHDCTPFLPIAGDPVTASDADRAKAAEVVRGLSPEQYVDEFVYDGDVEPLIDAVAAYGAAERAAAVTDLRARVEALAEEWDTDHADWCCQRGCPNFHGIHPGDVEFTTEGGIKQIGPDFPCPGECTCYVGPFRDSLRAAVTDTTGGTQ